MAGRQLQWRRGAILAVVLLFCISLITPIAAYADTDLVVGGTARVAYANGDDVRLRASAGSNAEVVVMVPEGTTLNVLDGPITADNGSYWYQVQWGETTGYIVSDFLALDNGGSFSSATDVPTDEATEAPQGPGAGVTGFALILNTNGEGVRCRVAPDSSSTLITIIPEGSEISLLGPAQGEWQPVLCGDAAGFVHIAYVSYDGSLPPGNAYFGEPVTEETPVPTEEVPTEEPTEVVTEEVPTEVATEEPTEAVTEEVPTEDPTQVVTEEVPTEEPTEVVTEEVPTEVATEEPTEAVTEEVPTEEATVEETETATAEASPTETATAEETSTPVDASPTAEETSTSVDASPTAEVTETATATETVTATATVTETATATASATATATPQPDNSAAVMGYAVVTGTNGEGVRCRVAADYSSAVITIVAEGSTLELRGSATGDFQAVFCGGGKQGYIVAKFLQVTSKPGVATADADASFTTAAVSTMKVSGTGGGLNCRALPSYDGQVITIVTDGTSLQIRGKQKGDWMPVVCGGRRGFVFASYLVNTGSSSSGSSSGSGGNVETSAITGSATVNSGGDNLRCRQGASMTAKLIVELSDGSVVSLRGAKDNSGVWQRVYCGGQPGWVSAAYLTYGTSSGSGSGSVSTSGWTSGSSAKVTGTGGTGVRLRATAS